eukprot:scaffold320018_cov32-Tisochrysis_lutea.AAC.1
MQAQGPAASTRQRTALGDLSNKYSQLKDPVRGSKASVPLALPACQLRTPLCGCASAHSCPAVSAQLLCSQAGGVKGLSCKPSGGLLGGRGLFDRSHEDAGRSVVKELVDKVDMGDINNPQAMIPYLADIHRHYREAEVRYRRALIRNSLTRGGAALVLGLLELPHSPPKHPAGRAM